MAITRGQLTIVGPESAAELLFQYSVNGSSNWHTVFAEGDLYFRVSSDGGVSWSEPARFAGPSGISTYVHLAYANSADGSVGFSTSISTGKTYLGQWVSSSSTPSQIYGDYKWQKFVGEDGKGIVSATVRYQLHTSGTTPPTGTWLTDPPTPIQGRYSWTRTITTYTSGDPVTTYSVAYLATNGQNGADGKGITSTLIEYAQSLSGTTTPSSWSTTRPSPIKGQYLWTKTTISYSDSTNSISYNISYSATDGQKGDKGDPGIQGIPGNDGQSQWTHLRYSVASNGNPMVTAPTAATKYIGIAVTNSGTAPTGYASYTWQKFVGEDGDDGKGISSTVITYANHTNGTTAPTTGWQATPAPIKGQYLWTRTVTTYTDTSTVPTYSVAYQATDGQAGKGISSTVVEYAQTASGTTTPTTWSGTRPAPIKGQYLWSKITITYTDTTTSVSYNTSYSATDGQKGDPGIPGTPGDDGQQYWTWIKYADSPTTGMNDLPAGKSYIGIAHNKTSPTETSVYTDYTWSLIKGDKGDPGRSITAVDVHYAKHTNATTAPTTGWSTTAPAWENGKYIWSKTVTTYSTGSPTESTPACITGQAGGTGAVGRGVSSIVEQFYLSTSKTTQEGGNWSTTMPTWENGKYVWTRSLITYTSGIPATSATEPLVSSEWEAANDALEDAKDYTDEIDRKNETKSGNLLTKTFTGPDFEDLTVRGAFRLEALARAKGQGMINVYQADGEKTRVYSVAVDSEEFEQVVTGDAVVAGRNLLRNLLGNGGYRIGSSAVGITSRIDEDGNLEVTAAEVNQNYLSDAGMAQFKPAISAVVKTGDLVTFSTDIRSENSTAMPTFYMQPGMTYMTLSGTISGEFSRAYSTRVQVGDPLWAPHFGFQNLVGTYTLKRPVYRLGESSLYTPAHEDIDGNVRIEVTGTVEFESLELYGYSIVPAWVTDWSGTATKIGENYVLSPYIFAGQIDINGLATGVSVGMDLTPGDPKPASNLYGYTSGELSYQLTGNTFEMIGLNGTSAGLSTADPRALGVRFWAGAPHEDRDIAPFQVLEDGTLKATKAIIEGSFILTDPNSSNLVVKDTLGSFAYETANLLDDTSGTFETIQLRETVQYRLSSIRVGEDVFLKSGDNLVFTAKLNTPPASVRVGITLVSEIEQEIEEVIDDETVVKTILVEHIEEVYGTISPPESTDPDQSIYTARVDVTIPTGAIYLYPFYVFGDTSNPITWPDNLDGRNLLTVDSGNTRWYGLSEVYALDSAITYGEEYTVAAKFEITDIYTEKVRIRVPQQSTTPFIIGIEEIHASGGLVHFSTTSISGDPNSSNWWETGILVDFLGGNDQTTFGTIEWIQIWKGDIPLANMTSWEPPPITPPGQLIDLEHREQMVSRGEVMSVWRPSFNSLSKSVDDKRFVMNYADGLFSQSVQTSEYREKMAEFNAAIEAKADADDIPDVPALLVQYMKDDYWGIETLKTTVNQHGTAVTLVQDSMGYEFIDPDLPDLGKNLVFRSAGSTMSLALKSDRISFRSDTEEVAWISGSSLHIASATIVNSLVIGSHMFEQWKDDKKYTVIRAV